MLIDVKARIDQENIRELLSYSVFPDPDRLEDAVKQYKEEVDRVLYGYETEGEIIGIVGFRYDQNKDLEILHIAVIPEERGNGYGRELLLELIEAENPQNQIIAETDDAAVDFYRNVGFRIESLGEKYDGVERFKCTYRIDAEE